MILLFRGYHPHKISGKAIYVNYLFRNSRTKNVFHDWNLLNLIHPKFTYLFRSYDLYILYSAKVFLILLLAKVFRPKISEIIVDSQENFFIIPIIKFFNYENISAIFYDFSDKEKIPSKSFQENILKCTRIIVMTNAMKKELCDKVPRIDQEKINVVYYKVSKEQFCPMAREELLKFKQKCNLPAKFILYVGSEQNRKNFFTLVNAFEKLQNRHPDLYLLKIGKDQAKDNRLKLNVKLNTSKRLKDKFMLVEECSDDDLVNYYNLAQLVVFPSLYEGFGIPLVEAMACGIPIVASNIETTREICGDSIIYVDDKKNDDKFAEKINMVLASKDLRRQLMKKSFYRSKKYTY